MNTQLNVYKTITNPTVFKIITIDTWFSGIKYSNRFSELICNARLLSKSEREQIKKTVPAITYNFLFDGYKKDDNIISSTGFLYIDIDIDGSFDNISFDVNTLDKSKIYAYYHSFSGIGYSIIVKVDGLTLENFKKSYLYIASDLGISNSIDKNAIKATQFNVLSYDDNIFINKNSFEYDVNNILSDEKSITTTIIPEEKSIITYIKRRKEEISGSDTFLLKEKVNIEIGGSDTFLKLKFKKELKLYSEDCVYIPEGKEFYECFIPFNKTVKVRQLAKGNRHTVLTMYMNNLLCLNTNMSYKQAIVTLKAVANKACTEIIPEKNLEEIAKYKFKELQEGNLKPVNVRLKKYWVDPSAKNKFELYNNKRKEHTQNLLLEFFGDELLNINHKVTYKLIAEIVNLSEITVKRNITDEYKELLKEHNFKYIKYKNK